ncbi:MAG: sigma-70 family RNA polymerase sigma factor [Planctomycetes bacterium]|nr:sigma-70 family RNA polymerase sigma factor [Planctomycetota bacterium]
MLPLAEDTDELLRRAEAGNREAISDLLDRHRERLRRMVAVRIDPRLSARVDPSDVLQESLAEAARQLPRYLKERPLPFYPWLRQLTWTRLVKLHQRHIKVQKRTVRREIGEELPLSDHSALRLAEQLVAADASPSEVLLHKEMRQRVRDALHHMTARDREVLVLWYLEQLTAGEIALILNLTEAGVKSRHRRALQRLIGNLSHDRGATDD